MRSIQNNSIIRFEGNIDGKLVYCDKRVLYKDTKECVLFNIDLKIAADPEIVLLSEVEKSLTQKTAAILDHDPIIERNLIRDDEISEASKQKQAYAVKIIHFILYKDGVLNFDVYIKRKRKKIIEGAVEYSKKLGNKLSNKTILRYLRAYWRGGMVDKALFPNYENCGSPGRPHNSKDKKIGRKSELEKRDGRLKPLYDQETLRMIFYITLEENYVGETPLSKVLDKVVENYFTKGWKEKDGRPEYDYVDKRLFPSYEQLYNFFKKEWRKDPIKYLKKKYGERKYNRDKRPQLGGLTHKASGPGLLYLVDSTIGDVYLVHTLDRKIIIGRPTIYAVVDVFSHMVVGFIVTMEQPSWISFLLALDNAYCDKVSFCAEHGIKIIDSMWPAKGLCVAIKGDRAELMSYISSKLQNLGIKTSNTAPYTPDWKGLVEKWLHLVSIEIQSIPGGVTHSYKRGEKDERLLACLAPEELTKTLIHAFLFYNNYHVIKEYPRSAGMIEDHIKCVPSVLWQWGTENLTGELRDWDRDDEMFNLLPEGTASITEDGFLFNGKIFHSDNLLEEQRLAVIAKNERRMKFGVVYDPRRPETIYCQLSGRKRFTPLHLSDDFKAFRRLHEMEWEKQAELDRCQSREDELEEQQARINKNLAISNIVTPASQEAMEAREGMSKNEQVKGIKGNRQTEIDHERKERALSPEIPSSQEKKPSPPKPKPRNSNGDYVPLPSKLALLEEVEEEETNGQL